MEERVYLEHKAILSIATEANLEDIFSLVDSYVSENGLIYIDPSIAKKTLTQITKINGVLLLRYNEEIVGGMAGYIMPGLFMKDNFFSTLFLYLKKDYRSLTKKLITEAEKILKVAGVSQLVYGVPYSLDSKNLGRFFRIMGYNNLETHYCKEI